ncbi:MAG: phosphorylase [Leptolyngbya sp. SIO1D8]|nr:phosphorylase [Leptolyngbya sp. SIO1D8]
MSLKEFAIQVVLVPAGAEYQSVKRAMQQVQNPPQMIAIPTGPQALKRFLITKQAQYVLQANRILVLGLGGSLSTAYTIGEGLLLEKMWCGFVTEGLPVYVCDRTLTQAIAQRLPHIALGTGVTCDRVITTAAEKHQLRDRYGADIVEMEGAALLRALPSHCSVAILRVISDDCHYDLPDISTAIGPDGHLKPMVLTWRFLRNPLAALRLIRGSLQALKALENVTVALFKTHDS